MEEYPPEEVIATQTTRLRVVPFARLLAAVFSLLGLIAGILYAFGGLLYDLSKTKSVNPGTALAFLALIGMPLLFALAGLISGLIGGWLFNRFWKFLGILEVDLELIDD